MPLIVVRDATPDDARGVADILNAIITARVYTIFDTPFSIDTERRFIRDFPSRGIFHVAVEAEGGGIVGFQNVEPLVTYTHALDHVGSIGTYVDLHRRRQGIASRLFEATCAVAPRKGYEKLFSYVRADNPAALATYARHGFRILGTAERHARIDGRYVDEIVIERLLDRGTEAGR